MVTGGDALVRVEVPANVKVRDVRVTLGNTDVTRMFRGDQGGHGLIGLDGSGGWKQRALRQGRSRPGGHCHAGKPPNNRSGVRRA